MMLSMTVFPVILVCFSFMLTISSLPAKKDHMLSSLLALEAAALSLYISLLLISTLITNENFYIFIYLSLAVCEGALGLSVLVSFSRSKGNDHLSGKNILMW